MKVRNHERHGVELPAITFRPKTVRARGGDHKVPRHCVFSFPAGQEGRTQCLKQRPPEMDHNDPSLLFSLTRRASLHLFFILSISLFCFFPFFLFFFAAPLYRFYPGYRRRSLPSFLCLILQSTPLYNRVRSFRRALTRVRLLWE